jgi:hypothetical protein
MKNNPRIFSTSPARIYIGRNAISGGSDLIV